MRSVLLAIRALASTVLLLGAVVCPGACGQRYYVNSVYNICKPNPVFSVDTAVLNNSTGAQAEVKVTELQAVPNDGRDDTAAVLSAIKVCRGEKSATILFPVGRYDFFAGANPGNPKTLFEVEGIENLTIDGQGSEFMMHGPTSIFSFVRCKNLTIRNVTIDWERMPFSQGRVLDVQSNYFDVDIFKDYPVSGNEQIRQILEYDPKTGNLANGGWWEMGAVEKTELLRPQVLRIHLKNKPKIRPGMIAVMKHYYYDYPAFWLNRCSNVRVENLTIYTALAMAFNTQVCKDMLFEKLRIVPRPGTDRLLSIVADGLHLSGSKGTVTIRDCQFARTGDDGVNFKCGLFLTMKSKSDDRTVLAFHDTVYHMPPDVPDPGDVVEFSHPEDMLPYATAVTKFAEILDGRVLNAKFEEPLPSEWREGDMMAIVSRTAKGRITNCSFSDIFNHCGRAILIQSRDVIVENCSFRDIGETPIWIGSEICNFNESIQPHDIMIRNNLFSNEHYGPERGCICIFAVLKDSKLPSKPGAHKNITVDGNIFRGLDNYAVFAAGVDGLVIKDNVVEQVVRDPIEAAVNCAFRVQSSRNIRIEGNSVDPARQGRDFKSALQFGPGCDKDTTVVGNNMGF
ncbi:MAG: glycosyl hydrolase family 28 protein [Armatimonadota bacterium]